MESNSKESRSNKPIAKSLLICLGLSPLLFAALFLYVLIANARLSPAHPETDGGIVFNEAVDHPVSSEMLQAAHELGGAQAPGFDAKGLKGQPLVLSSLSKDKPLVLFFVELQCPCCKGAKPYIDRIKQYYGDVCNVVGVIDAKPDMAQLWSDTVKPSFDVIPDPEMKIIRSFSAQRGVYTTLVAPGGKIVKAYPGYSQDMLSEMTGDIARLAGIKKRPMPLEPAPKKMTSGCIFPGTQVPDDQL